MKIDHSYEREIVVVYLTGISWSSSTAIKIQMMNQLLMKSWDKWGGCLLIVF